MLFSSRSAVYLTTLISIVNAQTNTPKGPSECGINLKNKVPPKDGDCSISGGIFSIAFPGELSTYLSKKKLSMGSGSEEPKAPGAASEKGSGKYPAEMKVDPGLPGHTIYAPSTPPDVAMPFLTWGNGACGTNPHGAKNDQGAFGTGYDNFLKEIASHGYVIAANGPMSGSQSHNKDVRASLDWAKGGGAKAYGKIDLSKIATMGHSCGGMEGMSVSYHNPDVKLTLMFNIATFYDDKRFLLKELKAPVAWFVGNPTDMGYENVSWPRVPDETDVHLTNLHHIVTVRLWQFNRRFSSFLGQPRHWPYGHIQSAVWWQRSESSCQFPRLAVPR